MYIYICIFITTCTHAFLSADYVRTCKHVCLSSFCAHATSVLARMHLPTLSFPYVSIACLTCEPSVWVRTCACACSSACLSDHISVVLNARIHTYVFLLNHLFGLGVARLCALQFPPSPRRPAVTAPCSVQCASPSVPRARGANRSGRDVTRSSTI